MIPSSRPLFKDEELAYIILKNQFISIDLRVFGKGSYRQGFERGVWDVYK